jgi:polysaccharide deacetylase family protein (PEP-CTERM system associated)
MAKMILSFDIEDWFCVSNMQKQMPFERWSECQPRIRIGTDFILDALRCRGIRATFFILGWIAERHPDLVRDIANDGHEIASHGYAHRRIGEFGKHSLREDVTRSIDAIHAACGVRPRGFRAPSFSVTRDTLWALEVLAECGIQYDSSIYPVFHPEYGIPDFPANIRQLGPIVEIPLTTARVASQQLAISGGGYFRIYPYRATRHLLQKANAIRPAVMYFQPWEFDPDQPRIPMPILARLRHYTGLKSNRSKFLRLLDEHEFCAIEDCLVGMGMLASPLASPVEG